MHASDYYGLVGVKTVKWVTSSQWRKNLPPDFKTKSAEPIVGYAHILQ